ncbi:AraC family transcriptional regulator [Spirochaetota bacterium]
MIFDIFHNRIFENSIPTHKIAHYCCYYITKGPGIITVRDKKHTCQKGDFLIVFPFEDHEYDLVDGKPFGIYLCSFQLSKEDGSIYNDIDLLRNNRMFNLKKNMLPVLEDIGRCIRNKNHYEQIRGEHQFISFLYEIISMKHRIINKTGSSHAGISDFLTFIPRHFPVKKNVTVRDIARKFNVSYETVRREFMDKAHISPQQYINNYRINYACVLLVEKETRIKDLAELLHFPDIYSFSKMFKHHKDMSPSEYKKKYGK